jgi:Protein of unknwon function (DUF3310)
MFDNHPVDALKVLGVQMSAEQEKSMREFLTQPVEVGTTGRVIDPRQVDHPKHYNMHPSGVEVIQVIRYMDFNVGSAVKYVLRRHQKIEGDPRQSVSKDLDKAMWYLRDELANVQPWAMPKFPYEATEAMESLICAEPVPQVQDFLRAVRDYLSFHQSYHLRTAIDCATALKLRECA